MDNYFDFLPNELLEITISYLDNRELDNFISIFENYKINFNWSTIYYYHFKRYKSIIVDYDLYNTFLSIEKLKDKINILRKFSAEEIYSFTRLDLARKNIEIIPPEIGKLINLRILYLGNNQIRIIPLEIGNLINLEIFALNDNSITSLPFEISKLIDLVSLSLKSNPINENEKAKIKSLLPNTNIYY